MELIHPLPACRASLQGVRGRGCRDMQGMLREGERNGGGADR